MFLDIDDRLGVVGQMSAFWRYRFPAGCRLELEEGADLFREFDSGLARKSRTEREWDQPRVA